MTFKEAQEYRIPFGKYQGEALDDIASTEDGLKYLEFIRTELQIKSAASRDVIETYLSDPTIRSELERIQ